MPRPSRRVVSGHGAAPGRAPGSGSMHGSPAGGSVGSSGPSSLPASRSVSASSASSGAGASGYDLSSSTSPLASSSASPARLAQAAGMISGASPAKLDRSISHYEVMYNTAVQAFVRRDHGKVQDTLGKLLDLLGNERAQVWSPSTDSASPKPAQTAWWDLPSSPTLPIEQQQSPANATIEEWTIRSLKLLISSLASLYSDPSPSTSRLSALPEHISALLPPTPSDRILTYLHAQCVTHAIPPPPLAPDGSRLPYNPASTLLPPALLSTLLLAALKIPGHASARWAHALAEDWISGLPDTFFEAISPSTVSSARRQAGQAGQVRHLHASGQMQVPGQGQVDQVGLQKLEAAREGYIKVVELFVGEILVRESEWEMARAFLEGESVIGSKRKENLYKHIRSAERAKQTTPTSSTFCTPDNSLILPSPTASGASGTIRPSPSAARSRSGVAARRSRTTSSAASSESEATARPAAFGSGSAGMDPGRCTGTATSSRMSSAPVSPVAQRHPRNSASGKNASSSSFLHPTLSGAPARKEIGTSAGGDDDHSVSESTRSTLPSRIFVNPFPTLSRGSTLGPGGPSASGSGKSRRSGASSPDNRPEGWAALIALLPRSVRARVEPIIRSPWLLALILGIPTIIGSLLGALILRRLFRRYITRLRARREARSLGALGARRTGAHFGLSIDAGPATFTDAAAHHGPVMLNRGKTASPAGIGGAIAPLSPLGWNRKNSAGDLVVHDLKERMKRQREGWVRWVRAVVGWWLSKIWGVWEMGTTITYI